MTKLRISIVEFLNTAPLVWGFTDGPLRGRYDLSFTVPSLCAEALRSGQVDVAIIPAIEYQRMNGMVVLPEMAVAAKGEVRSIPWRAGGVKPGLPASASYLHMVESRVRVAGRGITERGRARLCSAWFEPGILPLRSTPSVT